MRFGHHPINTQIPVKWFLLLLLIKGFSCTLRPLLLSLCVCVFVRVTLTEKARLHRVPVSTVLSLAFVEAFTTGLLLLLFPLFLPLLHSPQPTHCLLHMQACASTHMHACTQPSSPYAHANIHMRAA